MLSSTAGTHGGQQATVRSTQQCTHALLLCFQPRNRNIRKADFSLVVVHRRQGNGIQGLGMIMEHKTKQKRMKENSPKLMPVEDEG
jgi:hypothetical protein